MISLAKTEQKQTMWGVLEILGHRKIAGLLREEQILGTSLIRIDCYSHSQEKPLFTHYYSPQSLFSVLPCSEEVAKKFTDSSQPMPIQEWELRSNSALLEPASAFEEPYEDYDDDDDEDEDYEL